MYIIKHRFLILIALLPLFSGICRDPDAPPKGWYVSLYKNTPVYEVAKAIKQDDPEKIRRFFQKENSALINYQEPYYDQSLITFAISNNKYKAARALLELGADPNILDATGSNSVILASRSESTLNLLKSIIDHGGDVNSISTADIPIHFTPLITACSLPYTSVARLLIDSGADPYLTYKNGNKIRYPLRQAFMSRSIPVIKYLMFEVGVRFDPDMLAEDSLFHVPRYLRYMTVELGSEDHQDKMQIIDLLEEEYNIDYTSEPIPRHIDKNMRQKYPNEKDYRHYIENY